MNPPGHGRFVIGEESESGGRRSSDRPSNGSRIPSWLWPVLIAGLMGVGGAKVVLAGKEDQSAHNADMAEAKADRTAMRSDFEKAGIRDSAWKADVRKDMSEQRQILLDIQRQVKK